MPVIRMEALAVVPQASWSPAPLLQPQIDVHPQGEQLTVRSLWLGVHQQTLWTCAMLRA